MTIKEIARLADVSISTVSKIMNGKDESISKETKEKVLKIAKDYNYAPYAAVMNGNGSKRFLIGVILESAREDEELLAGIGRLAASEGYSVLCCQHEGSLEEERKAVVRLCHQKVDGVIWKRISEESKEAAKQFDKQDIPVFVCDDVDLEPKGRAFALDYGRLGYDAAKYLLEKKHTRLGCLYPGGAQRGLRFAKGFKRCLYDNGVECKDAMCVEWTEGFSLNDFMLYKITGIVCFNEEIASDMLKKAAKNSYKIPSDLSIIALGKEETAKLLSPALTVLEPPYEELGAFLAKKLIGKIEAGKTDKKEFVQKARLAPGASVDAVASSRMKKIVVVGSINMDALITVNEKAETGQTVIADGFTSLPGGKGSNQAVGAAKLGASVYLIGKVGQDYEAKVLRNAMHQWDINMSGLMETAVSATGKAYITVQKCGESSIVVYPGANKLLSKEDIMANASLFDDASFCLLQLETPLRTVEFAAKTAAAKGVKVILKPAATRELSDYLLKRVDMFVPNEKEILLLKPGNETLEEKAQYFLDKGVGHVIVTLGHKGCYLRDKDRSLYFTAADFEAVDTTGAADAFIAALAVFWAEGFDLILAIKYATYAAGLSITRQGAQSSLVDRLTLEMYGDEIDSSIRVSSQLGGNER